MKYKSYPLFLLILVSTCNFSCKTFRRIFKSNEVKDNFESFYTDSTSSAGEEDLPQEVYPGAYKPSARKIQDILHMNLQVALDFQNSQLKGKAQIDVKPWFYKADSLMLDAKAFDIDEISLVKQGNLRTPLPYTYDGEIIRIALDRPYTSKEQFRIFIQYTANPGRVSQEGSDAIQSAKGLYFINPKGNEPDKPTQVWTQGETESNSCWFPTIDKPNEKFTHELAITVPAKYRTLSNGLMIKSVKNSDSTRTDIWKMDQPHSAYLVMMAIGDYAVVKDKWRNIPVEYYVEPDYEPYAKRIFGKTPEMLEFFSNKLGVSYPWPKYAQVVVRDFVSGAMENTTATVFGEFAQKTPAELVDDNETERIIAHELFHHWFGDLVTCESWANLPLNESFATFAEYLWYEYKYGKDHADYHQAENISDYLSEATYKKRNLICFDYAGREDIFDRHSYEKGGAILQMLRNYVGDEAFFESLKTYLNDHTYQNAEIHDLRLAFEKISGEDLNWFFNQWFLGKGHPVVSVEKTYRESDNSLIISLKQNQEMEGSGSLFRLPFDVDVFENNQVKRFRIMLDSLSQQFILPVKSKPSMVIVDPGKNMVGVMDDNLSHEEAAYQLKNAPLYADRLSAFNRLINSPDYAMNTELITTALKDPFWDIRNKTLEALPGLAEHADIRIFKPLILNMFMDPDPRVRANAILKFRDFYLPDPMAFGLFKNSLSDSSAQVQISALASMFAADSSESVTYFESTLDKLVYPMSYGLAHVYAIMRVPNKSGFIQYIFSKLKNTNDRYYLLQSFSEYIITQGDSAIRGAEPFFTAISKDGSDLWLRVQGINGLRAIKSYYENQAGKFDTEIAELKKIKSDSSQIQKKEQKKAYYTDLAAKIDSGIQQVIDILKKENKNFDPDSLEIMD